MSHDQRPARMRVVKDPMALGQSSGDVATVDAIAEAVASVEAAGTVAAIGGRGRLPLLPAGLFLVACAAGGVLVAVVRPLGLG